MKKLYNLARHQAVCPRSFRTASMVFFTFILWHGVALNPVQAQWRQVQQLEFLKEGKGQEYCHLLPLKEQGLLVTLEKEQGFRREVTWDFVRLDSSFKELWKVSYTIPVLYEPLLSYQNEQYYFWLLAEPESENIKILRLDLQLGETEEFSGKLVGLRVASYFKVLGNTAFVGGSFMDRPVVLSFSFFNQSTKPLQGIYSKYFELSGLELDEENNEVWVLLKDRRKGNCMLDVQRYSYDGKLLATLNLGEQAEEKLHFITGKSITSNKQPILVGNYTKGCNDYARGFFVSHFQADDTHKSQLYAFDELENFFSYLSPKRQERMREKIEMKKRLGRESNLSFRVLLHPLLKTQEGFILVAEALFLGAVSPNNTAFVDVPLRNRTSFSKPLPYRQTAEFRHSHGIVCGFDKNGKLLWDNAIDLKSIGSIVLEEQLFVGIKNDKVYLSFMEKGKLHLQVTQGNKVIAEPEPYEIYAYENDRHRDEDAAVSHWYDDYCLVWGTRHIDNAKAGSADASFYIKKVQYQLPATRSGE